MFDVYTFMFAPSRSQTKDVFIAKSRSRADTSGLVLGLWARPRQSFFFDIFVVKAVTWTYMR